MAAWLCTGASATPVEVTILPPGEGCTHKGEERDHVHVERFHRSAEKTNVALAVPTRLSAEFEATRATLTGEVWCAEGIESRYATGAEAAVFDSALLMLLGVGVAQDVDEARERLLAVVGDDRGKAENALMILVRMHFEDAVLDDDLEAALLICELVERDNEEARSWMQNARWILNDQKEFDKALALARLEFERESNPETRMQLGEALLANGELEEAFQVATSALKDGGLSDIEEGRLRMVRIQSALKAGRLSDLDAEDVSFLRSSLADRGLFRKVMTLLMFSIPLVVLARSTRLRRTAIPGWLLTSSWVGVTMVGATIGLLMGMSVPVGIVMVVSILFAISGGKSLKFFSKGEGSWPVQAGWVLAGCVAVIGFSFAYSIGYERVAGNPPGSQLVALLLTPENPLQLAGMLFFGGLCIPLVEEVCFRGFLFDWLGKRMSIMWALLVSSVLFGLLHGFAFAIPVGMIGILACLLRIRFKSLWGAFALHALNNSIAVFALYLGWE